MNKNILKLLAALTMVIDHAGLLLFPQVAVLRWIGRISFPLFACCVGDGCAYTRKPRAYLLRVLGLGIACQAAFAAEELLGGGTLRGSQALYLNILFTLSLAILLCTAFLRLQRRPSARNAALFAAAVLAVAGADVLCQTVTARTGVLVPVDYGAMGGFSLGMARYCLTQCSNMPYVWWSLLALPVLWAYDGQPGRRGWKWAFYVFYPAHLALLYLISEII